MAVDYLYRNADFQGDVLMRISQGSGKGHVLLLDVVYGRSVRQDLGLGILPVGG